jgi:hypothetical protein
VIECDISKKVDWMWSTDCVASTVTRSNSDGFFLWEHLKVQVYAVLPRAIKDLVARLQAAVTMADANMLRLV